MPRRIPHLSPRPSAGQRLADEGVQTMVNGWTRQPLMRLLAFDELYAAWGV